MIGWLFESVKYQHNNPEVSKIIRQHFRQIINLTDQRGCNLLHIISEHNNISLLYLLLGLYDQQPLALTKKDWINLTDNEQNTPLHYAAFRGSLKIVELLQKHGAKSKAVNKKGLNCMHFAAQGGSPLIMYYYKQKGISVDCIDHNGNTPLHWAVYAGSDCAVAALLSWGACSDLQEQNGDTPLHIAVMFGRLKSIARLVTEGCDVNIKNKNDMTAYDLAIEQGYENIESYLLPEPQSCINKAFCRQSNPSIKKSSMFSLSVFLLLFSLTANAASIYIYSNTQISALYIATVFLGVINFVLLIILHNSNPGDVSSLKCDKDAYMRLLSENDPKMICFQCEIKKPMRSKHCYNCGKCIRVFDHHCSWVGNCIGTNNILLFIILLLSSQLYIILTLISHTISLVTINQYDFGVRLIGVFVCSSFSLLLSVLAVFPISYLFIRHCRLSCMGVSFYQHYKMRITNQSNEDIMLKQKRKLATGREQLMNNGKPPSEDSSSTQRRPLINISQDKPKDQQLQKGCCQQARRVLWKNKYVKQYGWSGQ